MYSDLQHTIGFTFADKQLLQLALTHASCAGDNYERLEYLGDALLDFLVGEALFRAHPDWPEGKLTVERAALVSNERLADVFSSLSLRTYIKAINLAAKPSKKVCANFVESLLGAIYLDANGGLQEARRFVETYILCDEHEAFDYVSAILHEFSVHYPTGKICKAQDVGDVHHPLFSVSVVLDGATIGQGVSQSKKNAAKIACKEAWQHLTKEQ